jgi:predicted  nucleic acid-binding Zn-ribbon protein
MGQMLEGLLKLQSIERDLAQVRRRLKARQNAVNIQQRRIDQLQENWEALEQRRLLLRRDADRQQLDLKASEEQVARLRTALNSARTNKEYAAILTQINTRKADNAKLEESTLRTMQEEDGVRAEANRAREQIDQEARRLAEIRQTNAGEIEKLQGMMQELSARRGEAAKDIDPETLNAFERVADRYEGEAMAAIQIEGKRPPFDYICGGCFMSLNAEHANALRVRDEIRTCDNCGRILYLDPAQQLQS